jgi:predicted MPP superfamily phosphohydrolase
MAIVKLPRPDGHAEWRSVRQARETTPFIRWTRWGRGCVSRLAHVLPYLEHLCWMVGLRRRGMRNAMTPGLERTDLYFENLPPNFDGYTILHVSDVHQMRLADLMAAVVPLLADVTPDLTVLTGDIQTWGRPDPARAVANLAPLLAAGRAQDGIVGVLGNHDTATLVEALEAVGVTVLVNEHCFVERGCDRIQITGVDDVHNFHTDAAGRALADPPSDFALALVHSPEMADLAGEAGYALYLAGHTHGGQICLPGGRPLMVALDRYRDLASGLWRFKGMLGYTSRGLGTGGAPLRFNCPPQLTLHRLWRGRRQ